MPEIPDFLGGPNGWLGISAVMVLLVAFFWKPVRALLKLVKSLMLFAEDWNGTPERRDHAGAVVEKGKPGVPALLEIVRSQVQNSHGTNFRDDLDANTAATRAALDQIEEVSRKLDEHIVIAKLSDKAQDQTAEQVSKLADDVSKLTSKYVSE